jgi:prepilin-type N-terminal cleavage/methylation domain-containing protein
MLNRLKKDNKGFTIIEVMIVLAIAALIMLIVFLAIPALQRNSRNTGRKSDAARISAAAANFGSNNNGLTPSTTAHAQQILDDAGTLGQLGGLTAGTGAMAAGTFHITSGAIATAPTLPRSGLGAALLDTGAQCAAGGTTAVGTNARQSAILYTIEPGAGTNYLIVCIDV